MKYGYTILTLTLLLSGCTREYECCVLRPECNNEITDGIFPYTVPNYIVGWTKDEERAEELCESEYNTGLKNVLRVRIGPDSTLTMRRYNCECERVN